MSAVNECFPVRCMKSLHGTHRSYRSPSQHQKQTNFSIYPCLAVQKSGRKEGKRSELLSRCWLWSLVCFPRASYGNKWGILMERQQKVNALELNYCKARAAPLSLSSGPSERARERERERERELPITTASGSRVCTVSCVWEYIENPIKLMRSVKKDS